MRALAEWNVITHIALVRGPTSISTRSRISWAALFVKVIARISPGRALPVRIRCAIRWVRPGVLAEPVLQGARLARAGAGSHQQRPLLVEHALALGLVEPLEQRVDGGRGLHPVED